MSSDLGLETHSPPSRPPWGLVGVLLACTTTCYIDRIALSGLAPTLLDEFDMTNSEYAFVVNCFMVTYAVMYSVGGRLADVLGFRRALFLYVVWWSIAGSMHALSAGFRSLAFYRLLLAVGQGGVWPASMKTVAHEVRGPIKSFAVGIVNVGSSLGSAVTVPLVSWLTLVYGWRAAFLVTGLIGFLVLPFWLSLTRRLSLGPDEEKNAEAIPWLHVVRYRQAWAVFLARMTAAGVWGFYVYWIPPYLAQDKGLDITQIGLMAWIPYVMSGFGDLWGTGMASWLIARGWTVNRARKTVLCIAGIAATALIGAAYTPSIWLAMACISLGALGFKTVSVNLLNLPNDYFPASFVGTSFGFSGTGASVGIVLTTAAIGWVLDTTGNYLPVLVGIGLLSPLAVIVTFVVGGRIEPVRGIGHGPVHKTSPSA